MPATRRERIATLLKPLLAGLGAVLLALAFAYLADEVSEGATGSFDMRILRSARALRASHPWIADVMRDFSGLGSIAVLTLFTLATIGYLVLVRARTTALLIAVSIASGWAVTSLFKVVFGRLRPAAAFAEFTVSSLSFPSGHASMSAIVFLTLGALLASTRIRRIERVYILATSAAFTFLVGISRISLGVHWTTDVLGGWAFGAAWAAAWLLLARWAVERPAAAPPGLDPARRTSAARPAAARR